MDEHQLTGNTSKRTSSLRDNNTALLLKATELQKQLWEDDMDIVALKDNTDTKDDSMGYPDLARRQEIFLDALVQECTLADGHKFLLSERFSAQLFDSEQLLKDILLNARKEILKIPNYTFLSASHVVEDMYKTLGSVSLAHPSFPKHSPKAGHWHKFVNSFSEKQKQAVEFLEDGTAAEHSGDVDKAVYCYRQAFKIWPELESVVPTNNGTYKDGLWISYPS